MEHAAQLRISADYIEAIAVRLAVMDDDRLIEPKRELDLTDKQCQALLKSAHPLQDAFDAWEKREGSHMEEVLSIMEDRANTAIREDRGQSHREER